MSKCVVFKIVATPVVSSSVAYWISPNAVLPCGSRVGSLEEIRAMAHRYASRQTSMVVVIASDGVVQEANEYVDAREWVEDGTDLHPALWRGRGAYVPVNLPPDSICLV